MTTSAACPLEAPRIAWHGLRAPRSLAELADFVEMALPGDPRCRTAAAILRGKPGGRPAIDDDAALAEISWLLEEGRAKSIEEAARLVAAGLGGHSGGSTAKRLTKKYRALRSRETS